MSPNKEPCLKGKTPVFQSPSWLSGGQFLSIDLDMLPIIPHRIHGTGIFTYIWLIYLLNAGKYTGPMDPMGPGIYHGQYQPIRLSSTRDRNP